MRLPSGESNLVDLRLDVGHFRVRKCAIGLSLSEVADVADDGAVLLARMCSDVMMSLLPCVTKMSARGAAFPW